MHTHPKVAAVASQNWPFRHDAKCEPLLKFLKANIHEASSDAYPLNLPTRVREDPNKRVLVNALSVARKTTYSSSGTLLPSLTLTIVPINFASSFI